LFQAANEKLARTTAVLEEEKARAEALLYRMSGLIACFPAGQNPAAADGKQQPLNSQSVLSLLESTIASQSQQLHHQQHPLSTLSTTTAIDKQSSALGELNAAIGVADASFYCCDVSSKLWSVKHFESYGDVHC
jgi:hypothetical protein